MKNVRICTPVTGKTLSEFLFNLDKVQALSDLVELRVDYIENLKLKDLEILKEKVYKKAIFTFRKAREGGKSKIADKERVSFINKAIKLGFDYVDIEFSTLSDYFFKFEGPTKIIASYQNYDRTIQFPTLCSLIDQIDLANVDIIKIATKVNEEEDNKTLLRLLVDRPTKKNLIVVGMGKKGILTRIVSPLIGGYLTYASTSFSHSAPGQINIAELRQIYDRYGELSDSEL